MTAKVAMPLACPCCEHDRAASHHHETLRCLRCGHAWFPLDKLREPVEGIYEKGYFKGGDYEDYPAEEKALKRNFAKYCARMRRVLPESAEVLEVGCAYGFFVEAASGSFRLTGLDVSGEAVAAARVRGLPVQKGDLVEAAPRLGAFDAVCFWDCIEHLPDPFRQLLAANRVLRDGGRLFLTTGDLSALLPRIQGRGWRQYHPPSHLHYFTRSSMRALLERSGFGEVEMSSIAQWHSLANIFGGMSLHSRSPGISSAFGAAYRRLPRWIARWSLPIYTGDIVWVAARKGR